MLNIILPLASILCTIGGLVYTKSICFFVEPGSSIGISSHMLESTFAIGLIVLPLTIVACLILPYHQAFAKPHTSLPLSDIDCSWCIVVSPLNKSCIWIEFILCQSFFLLWLIKVNTEVQTVLILFEFSSLKKASDNRLKPHNGHRLIHRSRRISSSIRCLRWQWCLRSYGAS